MMLVDGIFWFFYVDYVFFEIKLYWDFNWFDLDKRGVYFVIYLLMVQDVYLCGYVDDEKFDNWKMEFRKELFVLKQIWEKKEV